MSWWDAMFGPGLTKSNPSGTTINDLNNATPGSIIRANSDHLDALRYQQQYMYQQIQSDSGSIDNKTSKEIMDHVLGEYWEEHNVELFTAGFSREEFLKSGLGEYFNGKEKIRDALLCTYFEIRRQQAQANRDKYQLQYDYMQEMANRNMQKARAQAQAQMAQAQYQNMRSPLNNQQSGQAIDQDMINEINKPRGKK